MKRDSSQEDEVIHIEITGEDQESLFLDGDFLEKFGLEAEELTITITEGQCPHCKKSLEGVKVKV